MIFPAYYKAKEIFTHTGADWDQLAPDDEVNAIDFAHKYINKEPQKKIASSKYSLEYCLAHSGETINEHFRREHTDNEDRRIAKMIAQNTCKTDLILYRGVCPYVYDLMKENAKQLRIRGIDLYEKGFLQCSLVKGHEIKSKTRLRIYVPAGTKCIYLGNVNDEQDFYEVDIMHGAKLKIISIDEPYINCRLIETE